MPLGIATGDTGMEPDPRRIEAERCARNVQQQGSRCHIVIDIQGVGRRRGARKLRPRVSVRIRPGERDRIEEPARQTSPARPDASRGECVGRSRRARRAEAPQRIRAQVRAVQIERVARDEGALKRKRHRDAPAIRQELVQPHRSRHVRGVIGHVGWIRAELTELGVTTGDVEREVGDVGRGDREVERAGRARLPHDVPQPDVVDPELRLVHQHSAMRPPDSARDLLHACEVRRRGTRIADVRDVRTIAHHERAVPPHQRRVGAPRKHVCAVARKPGLLDAGAQGQPAIELHHDFRLPRHGSRGPVIHVEVVLILPRLDEELEIAVLPARTAAARPDAQRSVLQEILVALRRKAQVRLGPLSDAEAVREESHRALVDFGGGQLEARVAAPRLIDDAGRGRVAEVAILGAHDRGDHLATARAAFAADPRDGRIAALHPRAADELHAREREVYLGIRTAPGRRRHHYRDPQRLHLPQARCADLDRVLAEWNAVQAPPSRATGRRDHAAVANKETLIANREYVPDEALRRARTGHRVEREVTVLVLGVDRAVMPSAA